MHVMVEMLVAAMERAGSGDPLATARALEGLLVLVVNRSVPAKTTKELIALMKAEPGTLNLVRSPTSVSCAR